MKNIRKFETEADMSNWQMSEDHVEPNVVLVEDTRSVLYNVKALRDVMIQHIDGSFYTTEEWAVNGFANDQSNGVAVFGTNAKFVIAKASLDTAVWSSDASNAVNGVMLTSNEATAKTDYAGEANTALIAVDDTSGAAYACANFTFPNGAKGYLPALGEWVEAYAYKEDINAAMALIGGTALGEEHFWSSTQYWAQEAWYLNWDSGVVRSGYKSSTHDTMYIYYYVRAFSAL